MTYFFKKQAKFSSLSLLLSLERKKKITTTNPIKTKENAFFYLLSSPIYQFSLKKASFFFLLNCQKKKEAKKKNNLLFKKVGKKSGKFSSLSLLLSPFSLISQRRERKKKITPTNQINRFNSSFISYFLIFSPRKSIIVF